MLLNGAELTIQIGGHDAGRSLGSLVAGRQLSSWMYGAYWHSDQVRKKKLVSIDSRRYSMRRSRGKLIKCENREIVLKVSRGLCPALVLSHASYLFGPHQQTVKRDESQIIGFSRIRNFVLDWKEHSQTRPTIWVSTTEWGEKERRKRVVRLS